MAATAKQEQTQRLREAQINKALGTFLLFFALVVLVSIFLTDTGIGKLTNLGAGTVIGTIGGLMFLQGLRAGRKQV